MLSKRRHTPFPLRDDDKANINTPNSPLIPQRATHCLHSTSIAAADVKTATRNPLHTNSLNDPPWLSAHLRRESVIPTTDRNLSQRSSETDVKRMQKARHLLSAALNISASRPQLPRPVDDKRWQRCRIIWQCRLGCRW